MNAATLHLRAESQNQAQLLQTNGQGECQSHLTPSPSFVPECHPKEPWWDPPQTKTKNQVTLKVVSKRAIAEPMMSLKEGLIKTI